MTQSAEEVAKLIDGAWNRSAPGHWLVADGDRLKADLLQALLAAGYAKRSDTIEECALYEECWNIKTERAVLFYAWELTDARRRGLEKAAHESGRVVRRTKTWARLIGEEIIRLHKLQDKIRAALRSLSGGE